MNDTLGENILNRFTPSAARALQDEIAAAGGHEVFFAGQLDSEARITSLKVCARGNRHAVPALFEGLELRDVVVHNHPSGELTPSPADLDLAVVYSAQGHGVYIVDNEATRVYVVVEPFLQKHQTPLDIPSLAKAFQPDGVMSRRLTDFEERPQQTALLTMVSRAFNEERIAVVEAPTGVGKTLAYLLPAAIWATRNKERVVISTRTINLQEQIIDKDIPLLQRCFKDKFHACLVKGRGNYLCLRKLERALSEVELFQDEEERVQLDHIAAWAEKTEDGSLADLPFVPGRQTWEKVCSEADACSRGRCPDAKRCFVGKARREVAKADLLVVNHHMLFSDVAIKRESKDFSAAGVLPAFKRLIFDEAHSIEDSATEYFGLSATRLGAMASLGRLYRIERERERGVIPLLQARLMKECPQLSVTEYDQLMRVMGEQLIPALKTCREGMDGAFDGIRELTAERCGQIGREIKWRLTELSLADPVVRSFHAEILLPLVQQIQEAVKHCRALERRLDEIRPVDDQKESPVATEQHMLGAYGDRLDRVGEALAEILSPTLAQNTVRWIEMDSQNAQFVRIMRCPLNVGKPLAEWLYENLRSLVMTSATLTVQQRFDYLFSRVGLDQVDPMRLLTQILDSPFHYETQAMLVIPQDLPMPDAPEFAAASVAFIRDAILITRGHAFVLFTSYGALEFAFRSLEKELRDNGVTALKQGQTTRSQLIDQFRKIPSSVLFATDSFWEGVDVAGDDLQCVILPKLPFRVPTEPIQQARAEAIEAAGGNAFRDYSVPQAVIKFRQGFGRLIRRQSDRGVVIVLDRRIIARSYGRIFLNSLPAVRIVKGPARGVLLSLKKFFKPNDGES